MYVLLGANGNITSKAVRRLLRAGRPVRVVGRSAQDLAPLRAAGADTAIGDITDEVFLGGAFAGASAVYAMIPADHAAADHLRPGGFYENHLAAIAGIRALGAYADMNDSGAPIPMTATDDIAEVVSRELVSAARSGTRVLHLHAQRHYSMAECAAILGAAIGKPGLRHVKADPAAARAELERYGFSADAARQYEEMYAAFSSGRLADGLTASPTEIAPTALEKFAEAVFRPAFEGAPSRASL